MCTPAHCLRVNEYRNASFACVVKVATCIQHASSCLTSLASCHHTARALSLLDAGVPLTLALLVFTMYFLPAANITVAALTMPHPLTSSSSLTMTLACSKISAADHQQPAQYGMPPSGHDTQVCTHTFHAADTSTCSNRSSERYDSPLLNSASPWQS